jgi:zinc D-Ala-D-Ala carboxypeptidase
MATYLTKNFTVEELTASNTAKARGINNTPTPEHLENMKYVCEKILEPVRAFFDLPVVVNSSYRSAALNKAVGGASLSQHLNGEAVDFEIPGVSNRVIADWICDNLDHDQVILEFYVEGNDSSGWVHVSLQKSGVNRKQKIIAKKDGSTTKYYGVDNFDKADRWKSLRKWKAA